MEKFSNLTNWGRQDELQLIFPVQGRLRKIMTGRGETEFSPADFYEELRSSINEQIDVQIEIFKKELLMVRPDQMYTDNWTWIHTI